MQDVVFSVTDFVASLNQTLEFAYPNVVIAGELANFRVSKNRWVYFDLKDELSTVKFFATIYQLPGPLEDGMLLQVRGTPRLHPQYGFSITAQSIQLVGEGSLKRAAALLEAKLRAEGLFDPARKRQLPYPPSSIGLITSGQSAAYHDFTKVLDERWGGAEIYLADVQVQGEISPGQIVRAVEYFNQQAHSPEVLVITRGGGSAEDLAAFNTEQVTRAVAASRIPTLVAIGHEVDISLAELAADVRASTPSHAVQLLVPDRRRELVKLTDTQQSLGRFLTRFVSDGQRTLIERAAQLSQSITQYLAAKGQFLSTKQELLVALSPESVLKRGYAIVRSGGTVVRSGRNLKTGSKITAQLSDADISATVDNISVQ